MKSLDELTQLLGSPGFCNRDPGAWTDLERYLESELPADCKAFLDAYGSGMIANTLIVTHPACETDGVALAVALAMTPELNRQPAVAGRP